MSDRPPFGLPVLVQIVDVGELRILVADEEVFSIRRDRHSCGSVSGTQGGQQGEAAAAKISVGEGDSGVVVALSIPSEAAGDPRPDVDVTVGRTPLVGDAPPSDGTGVDVSLAPTTALFSLNGLPSR